MYPSLSSTQNSSPSTLSHTTLPSQSTSATQGTVNQGHGLGFPQSHLGSGVAGLPDLNAMMFPSNDPFAYPNQPMTTFENLQFNQNGAAKTEDTFANLANGDFNMNLINSPTTQNLDPGVQVYGPLPPYLDQSQSVTGMDSLTLPNNNNSTSNNNDNNVGDMSGINGAMNLTGTVGGQDGMMFTQPLGPQFRGTGATGAGMNLDDIFNGEEWTDMLMNDGFGRP
jgi:hypothetical protein